MSNNQDPRKVLVDQEMLVELARLAGVPLENLSRGQLVPRQATVPSEYTITDDSVRNEILPPNVETAPELNLNQNRNKIVDETFGAGVLR